MGEVVVAVVGEAELQDRAADVVGEGGPGGGGRGLEAVVACGRGGEGALEVAVLVVVEAGDVVRVAVDADQDAIGGVGGAGARAEAERGGVAGLAVAASSASTHGDGRAAMADGAGEAVACGEVSDLCGVYFFWEKM